MKLLIDARILGPQKGGIGRYTYEFLTALARADIDSDLSITVLMRPQTVETKVSLPQSIKVHYSDTREYTVAEQVMLFKLLSKTKPDVFHALHTNVPLLCSSRLVLTVHDLTFLDFNFNASTRRLPIYVLKNLAYRIIFNKALKSSKRIIVPSEFVAKELVSKYKVDTNKVSVIYEGVLPIFNKQKNLDTGTLSELGLKEHNYLLYVGSTYPHKDVGVVLKAINLYRITRSGDLKVVIVSKANSFRTRLEDMLERMSLHDTVMFVDSVDDATLVDLYKHCLAFVFPSTSEGFGLPGIEAMRAGTLVIASDIPVFREIYGDNALYFKVGKEMDLMDKIDSVVNMGADERSKLIATGIAYTNKFSWTKMISSVINLWNSIDMA